MYTDVILNKRVRQRSIKRLEPLQTDVRYPKHKDHIAKRLTEDIEMCNQHELDTIKNEVVKAAKTVLEDKLDKIILYGSYARGDNTSDSDIDFAILADVLREKAWKERVKISKLTYELDIEYDTLVSMYVIPKDEFYMLSSVPGYYSNILKDGVVVYEN